MKKQILILLVLLLSACASPPPTLPAADQLATVVAKTLTAQPVVFTPIPAFTSTSLPTSIPTTEFVFGTTSSQNVNLRTQPGMLFPVSRVMAQGTRLQIVGLAPGDEWAYVLNNEGIAGWVDIRFLHEITASQLQTVQPPNLQLVRGSVHDENGSEINGIVFSLTQGKLRTDAMTGVSGIFYAYFPLTASGTWRVSFNAIHVSSKAMDIACVNNNACGSTDPISVDIVLPVNDVLSFVWE